MEPSPFKVEPGKSHHAVAEVLGDKPRLTISGGTTRGNSATAPRRGRRWDSFALWNRVLSRVLGMTRTTSIVLCRAGLAASGGVGRAGISGPGGVAAFTGALRE